MKNHNESGRTMLEMLGVLAIMGVIMYGAIAGIGFGVNMYKINATFNDAEELSQGIIDLYSWSAGYPKTENIVDAVVNNDILSGVQRLGDRSGVLGPFGAIKIISPDKGAAKADRFGIMMTELPDIACSRLVIMSYANMVAIEDGKSAADSDYGYGTDYSTCTTDCSDPNNGTVCLMLR